MSQAEPNETLASPAANETAVVAGVGVAGTVE